MFSPYINLLLAGLLINLLLAGLLPFVLAGLLPFALYLLLGKRMIAILTAMKAGQPIREACSGVNAPEHQGKVGTPTMGGLLLIASVLVATLLTADLTAPSIHCCLLVMVVTAFLGFLDDYAKITKHSTDGVSGWFKIALQAVAALACACYLYYTLPAATQVRIPFYGGSVDIGLFFIPFALLVIIGSSNAVNLTDGLDGLAAGCMVPVCLTFILLTGFSTTTPLLLAMASACLGFLWFNCYPAKVFMGDTGSLSLGGTLGAVAVCSGTEFLLVIAGGVFVAEAVSVMIQVGWFKYTRKRYGEGRRFFRMAPLHHHFELGGWKETQVCVRFWIITILLCFLALASVII